MDERQEEDETKASSSSLKPRWNCPVCSHSDTNSARIHDHALDHHNTSGMLDLVEASVRKRCREKKKDQLLSRIKTLRGASTESVIMKTLFNQEHESGEESLERVVAESIIAAPLPLEASQKRWVYNLIQAGISYGANFVLKQETLPGEARVVLPDAWGMRVSRATMTKRVQEKCKEIIARGREAMLTVATAVGCTQVSDGRSNIVNDPLLVFGVQSGAAFLPQGAHNAGAEKKDAAYLADRSIEYLKRDPDLAAETFAVVSDGAPACLSAISLMERREYVVPIRCQSHALSLFLKGLALGPFKETVEKAVSIINWVRGRPRIHSLLWSISKKAVFRVVEVRFATHVTASMRLLELKAALIGLLCDDKFTEYKSNQPARVRIDFEKMETIIQDKAFWLDLKTFCSASLPGVEALRLLDRSAARAKDVNPVWLALGVALGKVLGDKNLSFDADRRLAIFNLYKKQRANAHRPVFDAAEVLNPANLATIRKHVNQAASDAARAEWKRMRTNTEICLQMLVRRKTLVDLRASLRAERSKRQRMDDAAKDEEEDEDEVSPELFEVKFRDTWAKVSEDFGDYYTGGGDYAEFKMTSESDWLRSDSRLKYYAIRILNMACTISDVERLHKVYSGIHTPARNRLLDCRVDDLAMARLILRIEEMERTTKARVRDEDIRGFASKTLDKAMDELITWGGELAEAYVAVSKTLQQPRDAIEVSETPGADVTADEQHEAAADTLLDPNVEESLRPADEADDGEEEAAEDSGLEVPSQLAMAVHEEEVAPPMPLFMMLF